MFLSSWREDLRRELRSNARQMLESRQPAVASRIDDSFPKEDVLNFYRNPLTSWSSAPPNIPDHNAWIAREPNLRDLATFCIDNFHWSAEDVVTKFSNLVWKGTLMQMLYSVSSLIYFMIVLNTYFVQSLLCYMTTLGDCFVLQIITLQSSRINESFDKASLETNLTPSLDLSHRHPTSSQ